MSVKPTSLALLVCDTPIPKVRTAHGEYPAIFTEFFQRSLPGGGGDTESVPKFTMDAYDVVHKQEYPDEARLGEYDAIVLTGSAASAYENLEWINKLVAYVVRIVESKPQIKIIGICFGHQIIARALGGECVPNDGKWEIGPTPVALTDLGKRVFGVDLINIQEMHRDHVPYLPPNFHLIGSTPVSYNQGMIRFHDNANPAVSSSTSTTPSSDADLKNIHIFTVQGHPEFHESIVSALVEARLSSGVISAEVAADAERRKDWRNDGTGAIGRAIWGVLGIKA